MTTCWKRNGAFAGLLGAMIGCGPAPGPIDEPDVVAPTAVKADLPAPEPVAKKPTVIPDTLKQRVQLAIEHVRRRDLLTTNAFWTIFHGMLAFGPGTTLLDSNSGTRVNAIDYIFSGRNDLGQIRGMVFIPTPWGMDVQMGPTFVGQGHQDQLFGYLVQCGLKPDRKVVAYGKEYTVMDFVRHSKMRARVGQELSWTIIVLGEFDGTDTTWTNSFGDKLAFTDLIRSEINAPVVGAACGGTHRLEGLTWCLHTHLRRGGKKEGVWKDLEDHLVKFQKQAKAEQNPDGTFSTSYFAGKGTDPDVQRRIGTTGHILEFLSMSLDDNQLREQWVQDAANRLSMLFLENQNIPMESGGLYHSVHGLVLYYRRVFGWEDMDKPTIEPKKDATAQVDKKS